MNLGTPLGASATKALLLGSGELGKELAIALLLKPGCLPEVI